MKIKPKKIVLASGNQKKVAELQLLMRALDILIIPQKDLGISDAVEDGLTFVENAIIKARHAAKISGLPAIADDSGLEVHALNGQPGIYSARFFLNEQANRSSFVSEMIGASTDDNNNQLLLEKMRDIPDQNRMASFQCALVYLRHAEDATPLICQGTWSGKIMRELSGEKGFGYDPVFFVPTHGVSAAELNLDEKNKISHRGQAMQKLLARFQQFYG